MVYGFIGISYEIALTSSVKFYLSKIERRNVLYENVV